VTPLRRRAGKISKNKMQIPRGLPLGWKRDSRTFEASTQALENRSPEDREQDRAGRATDQKSD